MILIPRVPSDACGGDLCGRTHREFVQIQLADDHSVFRLQPFDHMGVVRRQVILQHSAAARRRNSDLAHVVLNSNRKALQQPDRLTGPPLRIDFVSTCQCSVCVNTHKRVQGTVEVVNPSQARFCQSTARQFAGLKGVQELGSRLSVKICV